MQTNAWKYRKWRRSEGKSAYVAFQESHWFDEDITIEWLEFLLEIYLNMKIGVIIDKFPANDTPDVRRLLTILGLGDALKWDLSTEG